MSSFKFDFQYKTNGIIKNYKPAGPSLYGIQSVDADAGYRGSSVYFYDSLTISSTQKKEILSNINNGLNINGIGSCVRRYNYGDLIICKKDSGGKNNIYKLTKPAKTTDKFDIVFYGTIVQEEPSHSIIDTYIDNAVINLNMRNYRTECLVPVNRSFDVSTNLYYTNGDGVDITPTSSTSISKSYAEALRTMFGMSAEGVIDLRYTELLNDYDFVLKITIPLEKGLCGENAFLLRNGKSDVIYQNNPNFSEEIQTSQENRKICKFEKVIEIPLSKGNGYETYRKTYFSDLTCDKLHPAQNNANISFFDPKRSNGIRIATETSPQLNYARTWSISYKTGTGYYVYGYFINYSEFNNQARKGIFDTMDSLWRTETYVQTHPMIQYDKRKKIYSIDNIDNKCIVNYRGGESAYFSGMVPASFKNDAFSPSYVNTFNYPTADKYIGQYPNLNTYDAFVTMHRSLNSYCRDVDASNNTDYSTRVANRVNETQQYLYKQLKRFLLNDNNIYDLIYTEKATGLTKSKRLTFNQLKINEVS